MAYITVTLLISVIVLSGCEAISRGEETICVGICKHTEVETSGRASDSACSVIRREGKTDE